MKKTKLLTMGTGFATILFLAFMFFLKSGAIGSSSEKIKNIETLGITVEELVIPADARIVGIGEATHGNAEFQSVKLELLQKMAESGNCAAIAFEISVGEGALLNDAIHNENADFYELVGTLDYPLYDTAQIAELLGWMRDQNRGRAYGDSFLFYGVDMQGSYTGAKYLASFAERNRELFSDKECETLLALSDPDADRKSERKLFAELCERLENSDVRDAKIAALCANAVLQSLDAPDFNTDAKEYGEYRDRCMAENAKKISELEEARGFSQMLITAHNAHIMKGALEGYGGSTMGTRINELFEGNYFIIGTEFYNSCVNIHTAGTYDEEYERADHEYCSEDILAYQAQFFDEGRYVLDFSKITPDAGRVYDIIHRNNFMGLCGEGYNRDMDLYKSYRVKLTATDRYDAVIYYYKTNPIRCLHY